MTKSVKKAARYIIEPLETELSKLRWKVEQLQDQIRKERKRATQLEEELAFVRQQQVDQVRQRLNGVTP